MLRCLILSFVCSFALASWSLSVADDTATPASIDKSWTDSKVPDDWKKGPAANETYTIYYAGVRIPRELPQAEKVSLIVEAVDDAREIYVNGIKIGSLGSLPPDYRTGLGTTQEFEIPASAIKEDSGVLQVVIQCFHRDGRSNFNVAAPILFWGDTAIRLEGTWAKRTAPAAFDIAQLKNATTHFLSSKRAEFSKTESAAEVRASLKKLPGEEGKKTPQASLALLEVPEDLRVELVLAEPDIAQPVSMKFDARGRIWVAEYRQYPHPAGLAAMSRDKFLRAVYDKLPPPPPNHFPGRDRISIHEDRDGDGKFESHSVFLEGLSLCSSFEFDHDGLWVLQPPYLLFYPDQNHDDQPDGDPEVHLEGFGLEDAHSVASNLRWGPDGWLYAAQGSTVTGRIKRYGSSDKPVESQGQLIWRYHPRQKKYEVFAEGGGNAFGVEWDSQGRLFSGHNGGNTRGFHYVQGGYYSKSFGKHGQHSNPFTLGYLDSMKHHDAPRFTHALVIYDDTVLPAKYRGEMLGVAPLQGHVTHSSMARHGSSFQTTDTGLMLASKDPWFRPVDLQLGPDGCVYVADFYEQRIDHASHMQGRVDVESGRIYRIAPKENIASRKLPQNHEEFIETAIKGTERWRRQSASSVLQERLTKSDIAQLSSAITESDGQPALETLWLLARNQALTDSLTTTLLKHRDEHVRAWSIRLACDDGAVDPAYAKSLAELAQHEPSSDVRSQLAASARRLPAPEALPILESLATRDEDVADPHLPQMIWWGIEAKTDQARGDVLAMFSQREWWNHAIVQKVLAPKLMKRLVLTAQRKDLLDAAKLMRLAPGKPESLLLMSAMEEATQGRAMAKLPDELADAIAAAGVESPLLKLRRRDPAAIENALLTIADESADGASRGMMIAVLAQLKEPRVVPPLLTILDKTSSDSLRAATLSALQTFASDDIAARVLATYPQLADEQRQLAQSLLVSREKWALALLQAIDAGKIDAATIGEANVRRLLLYEADAIAILAAKHLPKPAGRDPTALRAEVDRLVKVAEAGIGNPYRGKKLYAQSCGKCHTLFGEGGQVGPNLTSHHREDLRGILLSVVDPSAEVREGFETFLVRTTDGRTLSGYIADQDASVVVLRTAEGESISLARDEIDEMRALPQSIMPEGLVRALKEDELRDLLAYLRSTQPLP
ncbi:membrane-bound dehydrogenase domain protein [Pirellula staleyi DSM 6068]|uniref:Membrane-bound dehydrogenase domain protein n=1 Tax=Pirellula staleyi (strain ATCC 27377 / DSM 6068 / ICPB 4128) TaxID=530564 RepID=D2QXC8_PIRSD|nr:PVC-type heme-binding CxxCH protein [Pirellula staleyi]ADB17968.1 membrane-bound dehydrogenase domain protein [Pirellula staleyi DSM 6068]